MRSDEEIERQLEDWLEDEARPMPHNVLENALESVTRTRQVDGQRAAMRWLRGGPAGLLAAAAVLGLVVVAGGLAIDRIGLLRPTQSASASASAGPPRRWDPAAEFRVAPSERNPSPDSYGNPDVWSYLSSAVPHIPSVYVRLSTFRDNQWIDPSIVAVYLDKGGLIVGPWESGGVVRWVILGWKSPVAGEVTITGRADLVQGPCVDAADGVTFSVDHEGRQMVTHDIRAGGSQSFSVSVTVSAGESIYFVVGPRTNSNCDAVVLILEITDA